MRTGAGGGHETAFAHGAGVLDAFPQAKVGIINLDAHLDLRHADQAHPYAVSLRRSLPLR